ncbi:hypothetical protein EV183_001678 [Coemansia sp. RSA 2336]|nr:hypothetical protein EV183_001678 [Coemansia sp. RSA 2336]
MGNWSAGMVRYHEPIRGKGWRSMLKRHGSRVYLIDEFRTSSICPACNSSLEMFCKVPNPRPWRRKKNPKVICHGLLRCKNETCLKSVANYEDSKRRRLWNRDVAATLNMLHILFSLRNDKCIPERFRRSMPKAEAIPKRKATPKAKAAPKRKRKTAATTKRPAKRPLPSDGDSSSDGKPLIKLLKCTTLHDANLTSDPAIARASALMVQSTGQDA